MKFRIFQSYYEPQQKTLLDSEFTPLDNTDNLNPELREYPILKKCHRLAQEQGLDAWGYFSWRWREKLGDVAARDVLKFIEDNAGHDVYIFNPQAEFSVACINVWEHGQYYHPKILEIMKRVYPGMSLGIKNLYQLMHPDTMFFSQYCTASMRFWDDYFLFLDRYINYIPNMDKDTQTLHDSSADYARDFDLGHFPFIIERLLSSFVAMTTDKYKIKTLHYHTVPRDYIYDKLYFLKESAIRYQDQRIVYEWLNFRKQVNWYLTLGQHWPITL